MNAKSILAFLLIFCGAGSLVFSGAVLPLQGGPVSTEQTIGITILASLGGTLALLVGMMMLLGFPGRARG